MASSMSQAILEVNGLTKRFGSVVALNNVSFNLHAGEVHSLCGENGAGKSTLIKCLSGIWPAGSYEGEIKVNGEVADFQSIRDTEAAGIAVIYQELALVREMTVAENIFLGAEPTNRWGGIDWNKIYTDAQRLLKQYGLQLDPAARVGDLGIGEQQLIEIVKALAKDTKILLLDEPTAALTEKEVDVLLNIIRDLRSRGVTCVYISHKLDEVFAISDRITVLRDGASIGTSLAASTNKSEIIQQMVGRKIEDLFPRRSTEAKDVLLKVSSLSVKDEVEDRIILDNISFEVHAGEVLGIGGLMGAGRTELVMHLFGGFGERVAGEVQLKGKPLPPCTPARAIASGMMLVSEDRKRYGLVLDKDIGFNQSLASLPSLTNGIFVDKLKEANRNWELFKALRVKAQGLETVVGTLSGGNQQKVVLAKALMTEPDVVFLDEPTRGIDVGAKLEVYELINRLTAEGKAVVLVSSELPELMGMSDRIVVLSEGKVGGEFTSAQAEQHLILEAAMAYS